MPDEKIPEPLTEEYLREHTLGELTPLTGPVRVEDYDPVWPQRFENEAARIRACLGDCALRLEHVGSTSVPDLPAKPVIDIVLEVTNSADEPEYAAALESARYRLRIREPGWHEHRLFKNSADDVNLHVFSQGCPEIHRMIVFRDWLRGNAADRDLYVRTKRELAQRTWHYMQNYADAKTVVILEIMARASTHKKLVF